MDTPLQDSWSEIDNGFYARAWGLRRYRVRDSMSYTGSSRSTQRLLVNTSTPKVTVKSAEGSPYGGIERTLDSNHSIYLRGKSLSQARKRNIGGPFLNEKLYITEPSKIPDHIEDTPVYNNLRGHSHSATGYFSPSRDFALWYNAIANGTIAFSSLNYPSDQKLRALGTEAIAATIPTKPEMSLSTSIAELKDGLPSMIGRQLVKDKSLNSLGSEYLNYQFGIAPMINDAKDVIRLTKQYESIIRQYRHDQGKVVRRRRLLADDEEVNSTGRESKQTYAYCGGGKYPLQTSIVQPDGYTYRRSTKTKIWFSGAYAIAYPKDADGLLQEISEFNKVYGVIPNAEMAWNLLPWSWLSDWFFNLGDIMTNVSYLSSPNTRLRYGYVMAHTKYENTYTSFAGPSYAHTRAAFGTPWRLEQSLVYERKRRIRASPFGFGVTFDGLSNHQKAILAALGLSRLRV